MCPPKFEIYLIFPNFLRSCLKLFGNSWGNSNTKFAILDIKFSFYLLWIGYVLKYCKVPKYYDQDCLKIFFCSLHFQWWLKFLEKVLISLKNVISIKKIPISKVESSLKSNFWPKSNIQNSTYAKPLNLEL